MLSPKSKKNVLKKDASYLNNARQRKTLKKEKKKRKMRKIQTATTTNTFLLLLFYIEKCIFCLKTHLEKLSVHCYICIAVILRGRFGNAVIKHQRSYRYAFVEAVLQHKILGNGLGILT